MTSNARIVFLHHSTGEVVFNGGVRPWLDEYNQREGKQYVIEEKTFPDGKSYPWANYPYDYWNLWVAHAGPHPYSGQDTLELLTARYQVIVLKHCFPVSAIAADIGNPDITSDRKSLENYKAQYLALRTKMLEFPATRFIVWTGAALKASETTPDQAKRARQFFEWVAQQWDEPNDNIFVWDFFELETEGGDWLAERNASGDSHPNREFASRVAPLLGQRIVDVLEGRGDRLPHRAE